MPKILLVGDSPLGTSGNANMMRAILKQLDQSKYQIGIYGADTGSKVTLDFYQFPPYTLIPILPRAEDKWGGQELLQIVNQQNVDVVVFVGIDIWTFSHTFDALEALRKKKNFVWISIFPYDLCHVRQDWVNWIRKVQYPCVYSQYGYNMLAPHVPHVQYYRPPVFLHEMFQYMGDQKKAELRKRFFPTLSDDDLLLGFIGHNQVRKDPLRAVMAYAKVREKRKNLYLYMHTDMDVGIYNINQMALDVGLKTGELIVKAKNTSTWTDFKTLTEIYNCFDMVVSSSLQEGLSLIPLEAMLSGVPVIATATTAHFELVGGAGRLVDCNELTFMPVMGGLGKTYVEARCCKVQDLADAIEELAGDETLRLSYREKGFKRAKEWLSGVRDINEMVEKCLQENRKTPTAVVKSEKKQAVLFCQHSSAGDVLMTTRCFKGLKGRYGDLPLHYMTLSKYTNIVEGNPYIDEILEWDLNPTKEYKYVVNPHGDRILPGHWGRNSNSILSDFYWKILDVVPDDFYVGMQKTDLFQRDSRPVCVLHTTGGDPHFRTYKYMSQVSAFLKEKYLTVQIGSKYDHPAEAEIDLRGKLSFQQSAYVMNEASLSVNVDSFISHLAGALGVSQITLFGSGNAVVVRPNQVKGELVCLIPDYIRQCPGLGPCSGAVRDCPTPCTGLHNPSTIIQEIEALEAYNQVRRNYEHQTSSYRFKFV